MTPIALQLYTLREAIAQDFESVVRHVAEIGYVGVETAGAYGDSPESAAKLFRELGLTVTSAHAPLPLLDNLSQAIAVAPILGAKRLVCAWYPPEKMQSVDDIRKMCDELNQANQAIRAAGLELHYHNHWQEASMVDGKRVYQYMLDFLDSNIGFEVDVYWAQTAGADPVAMLKELGKRAPLLHIKDGPATMDGDMTAVGEGVVNMKAIADATNDTAEWWIVELDRCATDMTQAVEKSYTYLTKNGLAHGK